MKPAMGSVFLLDVNALIAFSVIGHADHAKVYAWFQRTMRHRFSTCAVTQSGFVRLMSNPIIYTARVSPRNPLKALQELSSRPDHEFWPMDIDYAGATRSLQPRITGYRQTTDAYLLGLAIHHKGILATLDQAIVHLAGREFAEYVELIA